MHLDLLASGSVDDNVMNFLRILFKRRVQRKLILFAKRIQDSISKTLLICTGLPSHDGYSPLADAQILIRNDQILVKLHLIAQTETFRAGAKGIVKREASRLDLINADPAVRAGKVLAEVNRLPANDIHDQ